MKQTVYITRKLPNEIVEKLSQFQVRMWEEEGKPVPREILLKEVENVNGLICLLTDTIDEEVISRAKHLQIISNVAVGYNNIDVQAATKKGIIVTNTPGVLTETTADLTFTLLMAAARGIPAASDALRGGQWGAWSLMEFTGQDIFEATLGIIGLGRIGEALVKRAQGFNMNVLYYNRTRKYDKERELGITYAEQSELLQRSDYVCLMLPYSPEVHHLIGKEELSLMKRNAILINTARGGLVDEEALYHALKSGEIWGAGLDVFEQEPVPVDHHLLTLTNVVTLPHIGSASLKTRMKMAYLAVDNIIRVLNGDVPLTEVRL
ncbi:D-glycerate dehydrogenase (plasmid) [Niallia taxi]|uniref:2-hydroxyacid dehydrogenase n=1 Tax=Niallia taxi TaxID=2499688 RepID=UPI00119D4640|nr:D-glycerate dehydrogenase [Niallia taxi]MCT2347055.1 D-glycerate dehydrogenase [Niallia taxi]MED3962759.1 D-glycerate dehydrogenase [Niallia taxi]WOD65730.1 D-glycerate dehydrogenase [Niallia taxi]